MRKLIPVAVAACALACAATAGAALAPFARGERPVIFVAIRNLPYDWIVQLAGEGSLPFFDSARQRSYFARIEPFATSSE